MATKKATKGNNGEKRKETRPLIGFIGQGFIGKNYADDFEKRGFTVIRYAMEEPYRQNKEKIAECDIVFIAVPTPTTPEGFDYSIVEKVLRHVGKGKIAVIKSTLLPGTTEKLQKLYPDTFVMHSPEFLRAATAAQDAAYPNRNIVGIPLQTAEYRTKAGEVMRVFPKAPFELIVGSREAEFIKYGGNNFFYVKVVYLNLLYDLAKKLGADWKAVRGAMEADPRIGSSHMEPVHDGGRGAGGLCFIKDFAAFTDLYEKLVADPLGNKVLEALRDKNNALLKESGKDLELLEGVYGKSSKP